MVYNSIKHIVPKPNSISITHLNTDFKWFFYGNILVAPAENTYFIVQIVYCLLKRRDR